jgi:hypothetical protein
MLVVVELMEGYSIEMLGVVIHNEEGGMLSIR